MRASSVAQRDSSSIYIVRPQSNMRHQQPVTVIAIALHDIRLCYSAGLLEFDVWIDIGSGFRLAVEYLVSCMHRRIGARFGPGGYKRFRDGKISGYALYMFTPAVAPWNSAQCRNQVFCPMRKARSLVPLLGAARMRYSDVTLIRPKALIISQTACALCLRLSRTR